MPTNPNKRATRAVRAAIATDKHHGAVVPPIHLSSTYAFTAFNEKGRYDYSRSGNPTRDHLAEALAALEEGCGAVVTSSGMSAVALALQLVGPRGRVLAAHDCYGGTYRLLRALEARGQIELCFTNLTAPTAEAEIVKCAPAMVWVETPSNPLLRITDVRAVCAAARRVGAISVVDNTFLSPALQRPIPLGADLVVHSTTKYLNGHSDVVGGAVIAKDPVHLETLVWWANCLGLTGAPFDSYLTLRGVRTLFPRVRAHEENAQVIARVLDEHPAVIAVHYPGLATHPGHALATAQQDGYGAMISFEVAGGEGAVRELTAALQCFTLAESLGGVESLVAHPATMTHASMDAEARRIAGIGDGLLRLSVGIEDSADLVDDLVRALDAVSARALAEARQARSQRRKQRQPNSRAARA